MYSLQRDRSVSMSNGYCSVAQSDYSTHDADSQESLSVDSSDCKPRVCCPTSLTARKRVQRNLADDEFFMKHRSSSVSIGIASNPEEAGVSSLASSSSTSRTSPLHVSSSTATTLLEAIEDATFEKYAARVRRSRSLAILEHDDAEVKSRPLPPPRTMDTGKLQESRSSETLESSAPVPTKLRSHQVVVYVPGVDSGSTNSGSDQDQVVDEVQPSTSTQHSLTALYEAQGTSECYESETYEDVVERVVQELLQESKPAGSVQQMEHEDMEHKTKRPIESTMLFCIMRALLIVLWGAAAITAVVLITQPNEAVGGTPTASPSTLQSPIGSVLFESNQLPTARPTPLTREQELRAMLGSIRNPSFMDQPSSAHYKAFQWLLLVDEFVPIDRFQMTERFVLAVFYFSIEWPFWESQYPFLVRGTHHCGWKGYNNTEVVKCDGDLHVIVIAFNGADLLGTVPPELQYLTKLQGLGFYANELTGTIPTELGTMEFLTDLDLSHNYLQGTIPSQLFGLPPLRILELQDNELTGTIPSSIGDSHLLLGLFLYSNNLTGVVPSSVNNLSLLFSIELDHNNLRGPIPSLSNCPNLETIYFNGNNFTGTIPTELLHDRKHLALYLSDNQLKGTVPTDIGQLTNLRQLGLGSNLLTGSFSPLNAFPRLQYIDIYGNRFTGTLDHFLEGLPSELLSIELHRNNFTGTIPESIGDQTSLRHFSVHSNLLSGTIPSEIGLLTLVTSLSLNRNRLEGSIPTELGALSAQTRLELGSNILHGTLPSEFGSLTQLTMLEANSNHLVGSIPSEVGGVMNLTYLGVCCNSLEETIPTELSKLSRLSFIYIHNNALTGPIPESWSLITFPNVHHLYLHLNDLAGDLNNGFCHGTRALLRADCLGPDAEVKCSCCDTGCNRSDYCESLNSP